MDGPPPLERTPAEDDEAAAGAGTGEPAPPDAEEQTMASAEDIERLRRMFGGDLGGSASDE